MKLPDDGTACPVDGSTPIETRGEPDARLGVMAGGFRLLDVIGSGGMSTVYRAHQLSMDRMVAVKVMSRPSDRELVQRFLREAQQTAKLRSAQTINLYDHGLLASGEPFIAMELLSGRSLAKELEAKGALPIARVKWIAEEVCVSLEEAHAVGLVHRDVKPSNIMIEPPPVEGGAERVKVVDFGIVKVLGESASTLTETGWIFGTAAYMAPEMWGDKHGEIGPHTDVYALGIVIFEALTGKGPFEAKGTPQLGYAHVYETPRAIAAVRPDLAALPELSAIQRIVARCLEKRGGDRYRSIGELRKELQTIGSKRDPEPDDDATQKRRPLRSPRPDAGASASPTSPSPDRANDGEPGSDALRPGADPTPPAARATSLSLAGLLLTAALLAIWIAAAPNAGAPLPTHAAAPPQIATSSVASRPAIALDPPPKPRPPPKRGPRTRVTKAVAVSAIDAASALASLTPALVRCYDRTPSTERREVSIHLVIDQGGHPSSVVAKPDLPELAACVRPAAESTPIAIEDGVTFGTLSLAIGP